MNSNKICGNCGIKGHIYKECTGPITSIGIIAFRQNENDKLSDIFINYLDKVESNRNNENKVLLIQRKDTMGYIDLIRGKYPKDNAEKYIKIFISEMIPEEINSLKTKDFDTLWDELWADHTSKYYKNDKKEAKEKFSKLDLTKFINDSLIQQWCFQEFGLPKGRRNLHETFKKCAIREFEEETGYSSDDYIILDELGYIEEEFTGSNDIQYKHIYFLATIHNDSEYPSINPLNKYQLNEIKNIGFFTLSECMSLIRNYNTEKKNIITKCFNAINMFNNATRINNIKRFLKKN